MIAYSLLIGLTVIFDLLCENKRAGIHRGILLTLSFALMTILSGVRYEVGTDFNHYIEFYDWTAAGADMSFIEQGFLAYLKILLYLHIDVIGMFVTSSVLVCTSIFIFVKNFVEPRYWLFAVFLIVTTGYFFSSMNILRQYMALSFVLFAFYFFIKEKYWYSIFFYIVGFLFHKSVIFLLALFVVYPLIKSNRRYLYVVLLYLIAVGVAIIGVGNIVAPLLNLVGFWSSYSDNLAIEQRDMFAVLKAIAPNVLFVYGFCQKRYGLDDLNLPKLSTDKKLFLSDIIDAGAAIYCIMQIFASGFMLYTRVSEVFLPFYIIFAAKTLANTKGTFKYILWFTVILYYIFLTILTIFIMGGNGVMPYQTWLF